MNANQVRQRTKGFALSVIKLIESLPHTKTGDMIGKQLLRCGTSVGAKYHAACRAKSPADFITKRGIVAEEADESIYWLELLAETGMISKEEHIRLSDEANQLLSITLASIKTARANRETSAQAGQNKPRTEKYGDQ